MFVFNFDPEKSSSIFKIKNRILNELSSTSRIRQFDTAISEEGVIGGNHVFKVFIDLPRNYFKIGISADNNIPEGTGFSDLETGFAFYTKGQTRNGEMDSGFKYGEDFKNKALQLMITIVLRMGEGRLSYIYNQKNYGIAFKDEIIKKGPLYVALAFHGEVDSVSIY